MKHLYYGLAIVTIAFGISLIALGILIGTFGANTIFGAF